MKQVYVSIMLWVICASMVFAVDSNLSVIDSGDDWRQIEINLTSDPDPVAAFVVYIILPEDAENIVDDEESFGDGGWASTNSDASGYIYRVVSLSEEPIFDNQWVYRFNLSFPDEDFEIEYQFTMEDPSGSNLYDSGSVIEILVELEEDEEEVACDDSINLTLAYNESDSAFFVNITNSTVVDWINFSLETNVTLYEDNFTTSASYTGSIFSSLNFTSWDTLLFDQGIGASGAYYVNLTDVNTSSVCPVDYENLTFTIEAESDCTDDTDNDGDGDTDCDDSDCDEDDACTSEEDAGDGSAYCESNESVATTFNDLYSGGGQMAYDLVNETDPTQNASGGPFLMIFDSIETTFDGHFDYYDESCEKVDSPETGTIYYVNYTGPCSEYTYSFDDFDLLIEVPFPDDCYGETDYLDIRGDLYNLDLDDDGDTTVQDLMVYLAWYMSPFGDGYPLVVYGGSS